jgi:putative endonuclease
MKRLCIYILASKPYGTLYVGVTSDLSQRMAQHSQGLIEGFAKKYGVVMGTRRYLSRDAASEVSR